MYAHVPVCCPSRSSLISGQFMHNNGCRGNNPDTNCSSPAFQAGPEKRSYVTHLQAAGYATSFAGKYLNDYGTAQAGGVAHIPPGWTNWQGLVGNSIYYSYTLSNNGVAEHHGTDYAADYLPDVVLNRTLDFLGAHLGASPVFAVLSTPSCHGPQDAAPQYQVSFPDARAPRSPRFNASVPDAHWMQAARGVYPFDGNAASFSDLVFRRRVQTLATVDDMLAAVVAALEAAGQLDNTYIVYTADNGYHTGDFGLVYDKRQPWETDTHLPLLLRGPGVAAGSATAAPVSMVDLSATFLDMAGLAVPPHFDGASVLPFLRPAPAPPRLAAYIEYQGEGGDGGGRGVCARTAGQDLMCNAAGNYTRPPFFFGEDFCLCQDSPNTTYACLRVVEGAAADAERARALDGLDSAPRARAGADYRYCEWRGKDTTVEFFDYAADPYELTNAAAALPPARRAALSARLAAARACRGTGDCAGVLAGLVGPRADEARDLNAYMMAGGHVIVGF
jgi:N-acetylglucosamine-6-sulfatase